MKARIRRILDCRFWIFDFRTIQNPKSLLSNHLARRFGDANQATTWPFGRHGSLSTCAVSIGLVAFLLILPGCKTASYNRNPEAQAELDLAASQGKAIIEEIAQAAAKATFQVGDKIAVQIWLKDKTSQLSGFPLELAVPESEEVFLPHIGLVKVGGKTAREVQSELQGILDKMLKDVTVIVSRRAERAFGGLEGRLSVELGRHFIVMGHINRPGLYPLEPGLRVRDAIAVAGGLAKYAHARVYLVRGSQAQPEVKRINLDDIFYGNNLNDNVLLAANDAIYVSSKLLYQTADFITLLLSPIASPIAAVRDVALTMWTIDAMSIKTETKTETAP